nr:Acyltransferase [Penicillium sclerotiorum]
MADQQDVQYAPPDMLAQFHVLNGYSMLAFGFEFPEDVDRDAIVASLQTALDQLIEAIPWLGDQVTTNEQGLRTLSPWPEDVPKGKVIVKNCDDTITPMAELLAQNGPISKLPGKVLSPWNALPLPHGITGPVPVIAFQANFVRGGLILNLVQHHTFMDGVAAFQLLKLFALLLNGQELPAADLEQANRDRTKIIPLIPDGQPVKEFPELTPPPGWQFVMPTVWPTWCVFQMSVDSLAEIVKKAREVDDEADTGARISSDDILSAFYWQRICRIRVANGMSPDASSKLTRAVNARVPLGIPTSYLAAQVCPLNTRLPLSTVIELSVPKLARILRANLVDAATEWSVRSFATFMSKKTVQERATLLYTGTHNCDTDIGCSNISRLEKPKGAWGPLGECRFYRLTEEAPIPGSFRLAEAENGIHPVTVCLPEHDLLALRADEEWMKYAAYVG